MTAEKLTRRSFFRLAGGGIAAAVIAPKLLLDKVINIPVEFGWTWFVDKDKIPAIHLQDGLYNRESLSKIITETLRANTQKIAENVSANNALLMKLKDGTKVNLQIEQISPELQTERVNQRMKARIAQREQERLASLDHLNDENKEWLKRKSEAALNSNGFDWDERHVPLKIDHLDYMTEYRRQRNIKDAKEITS